MTSPYVTVHRSESSADYFDAAERGELLLRQCTQCGHDRIARRTTCRLCGHEASRGRVSTGTAQVVTWAANPRTREASGDDMTLFGLVELADGPWLETLLVGIKPDEVWVGMPVEVIFVRGDEGDAYPAFTSVTDPAPTASGPPS